MVDNVRTVKDLLGEDKNGGPINSPRSLEACLRKGYDPEELIYTCVRGSRVERPGRRGRRAARRTPRWALTRRLPSPARRSHKKLNKGSKSGLSEEMVTLQHDHFERRRQEKVKVVIAERERIIEFLANLQQANGLSLPAASKRNIKDNVLGQSPPVEDDVVERASELQSKSMEMEQRRIEAIKKRQQRELARMVESEQKLAELQKKLLATEEMEGVRKKEHEKNVAVQRAEALQKKRDRDLEKKKKEEAELQARRVIAEREQKREKEIAEKEQQRLRAASLDAMARDRERTAKMEEHANKSAIALQKQEELAEHNMRTLKQREERLRLQLEEKKAKKKAEIREQRAKAEVRIATALERNIKAQEDKKRAFDQKQEEAAHRAVEKAAELAESMTEQIAARDSKLSTRKQRLDEAVQKRADRITGIVEGRAKREQYYSVVTAKREKELTLKKCESELAKVDRVQNVARIRRIDDFLRLQTLQKVQEDDQRSVTIKAEKKFLAEQRKSTAHDAFLRKSRVREAMEQMRVTNKFVNLDHIAEGTDKKRKKKSLSRSESAPTSA